VYDTGEEAIGESEGASQLDYGGAVRFMCGGPGPGDPRSQKVRPVSWYAPGAGWCGDGGTGEDGILTVMRKRSGRQCGHV
jgi:hypothetical protein